MENKPTTRPVLATEFVRKMRGGSQSCLIRAGDGNVYVVKLIGNPQGSEVLFNEAFGTELMRLVGLPVPEWCPVELSDEFIDRHPGLWFETATPGRQRPTAGLHFGSRFIAPKETEPVYEILPRSWFHLIDNRGSFIGALLFDLWANQMDNRQALFLRNAKDRSIHAVFIDHGSLFGRSRSAHQGKDMRIMFMDHMMYEDLDIDLIVPMWESRIHSLEMEKMTTLSNLLSMPVEWYAPTTLDQTLGRLIESQKSLAVHSSSVRLWLKKCCAETSVNKSNARLCDMQLHCP